MNVTFNGTLCTIHKSTYQNRRTRLQLVNAEDGMPEATCTVNLPNEDLNFGELAIKDYSENAGMYQALLDADVIMPFHKKINSGHVEVLICYTAP